MAIELEQPPRVPWDRFITTQVERNRIAAASGKGFHRVIVGQTQSGKTTLNRILLRMKKTVLMFGTKPKDDSLEDYIRTEGFVRIDHWPPTRKELKQRGPYDQVKLLLWPKITAYADLKKWKTLYRRAIEDITVEPYWTASIDEGNYFCSSKFLGLGDEVSAIAFGGASNGSSEHLLLQRPRGIDPITYGSGHDLFLFPIGNTNDIRELASYSKQTAREVAAAVKSLNRGNPDRGHEFLYLPFVGGASWAISEVPSNWV